MNRSVHNLESKAIHFHRLMYRRGAAFLIGILYLVLLLLLLFSIPRAQGQILSAKAFPGSSVGAKVTNAQTNGCNPDTSVTCVIVIEPELSAWSAGSLPTPSARTVIVDWRSATAGPQFAFNGSATLVAIPSAFTGGSVTSPILAPDGSAALPAYSYSGATNWGMLRGSGGLFLSIGGGLGVQADGSGVVTPSSGRFGWCSTTITVSGCTPDTKFSRQSIGVIAQTNGIVPFMIDKQDPAGAITGNSTDLTIYTTSVPANALGSGKCLQLFADWSHSTGSASVTYKLTVGSTANTVVVANGTAQGAESLSATVCNNSGSTTAQWAAGSFAFVSATVSDKGAFFGTGNGTTTGAWNLTLTFNVANTDQVTPKGWYVLALP